MASTPAAAADFAQRVDQLLTVMLIAARQSWARVPGRAIWSGWAVIAPELLAQLAATQITAARDGADYVPLVLDELGIPADAVATVVPQSLAVGTQSGVDLATLLNSVPLRALHVTSIDGPDAGLEAGLNLLTGIIDTGVADAARLGASLRTVASPRVGGYIREVSPGACARCLVLAGRWYRWSAGFLRHPRCHCVNVPVGQAQSRGMVTDPAEAFRGMSRAEQDRIFTAAGAKAIRDGADISRVVNARRGVDYAGSPGARRMATRSVFGRDVFTTTEGTTARGVLGAQVAGRARLMPESIYQLASDREDAIRLLRLHGYLI